MMVLRAAVLVLSVFVATGAEAETFLDAPFDARGLDRDEKRFLQVSLAFARHYNGLLDGAWGAGSQRALERYVRDRFDAGEPLQMHSAALVADVTQTFDDNGWDIVHSDVLDFSFLNPRLALEAGAPSDVFVNVEHGRSSLDYSMTRDDLPGTVALHDEIASWPSQDAPYLVRTGDLIVTSVTSPDGVTLCARSDLRGGAWSTLLVSAAHADRGILSAVTASIAPGPAEPLFIPPGGILERTIDALLARIAPEAPPDAAEPPDANAAAPRTRPRSPRGQASPCRPGVMS